VDVSVRASDLLHWSRILDTPTSQMDAVVHGTWKAEGMPTEREIATWRLHTQLLNGGRADDARSAVGHLLCVQAENAAQSAWAVACRTKAPSGGDLLSCLGDGRIVRTHVLRPTWHYALAEDIGWIVDLTGPRVRVTVTPQLERAHGVDAVAADARQEVMLELLEAGEHLTRPELSEGLEGRRLPTPGGALMVLLLRMELDQLIISGTPREGVHTYALFSDRVRAPRRLERDEALAELARRYVVGHGPVTERDLAYWATLTLTDARRGLAAGAAEFATFEHDGRTYWHLGDPPSAVPEPRAHLLQILDEMYRGYQDSRMVLDPEGIVPQGRETAIGMLLLDGLLVGGMKRTTSRDSARFEITPYRPLTPADRRAVDEAAARYASFLGLQPHVELRDL
jgi:Winged helix DNA-binding domain